MSKKFNSINEGTTFLKDPVSNSQQLAATATCPFCYFKKKVHKNNKGEKGSWALSIFYRHVKEKHIVSQPDGKENVATSEKGINKYFTELGSPGTSSQNSGNSIEIIENIVVQLALLSNLQDQMEISREIFLDLLLRKMVKKINFNI